MARFLDTSFPNAIITSFNLVCHPKAAAIMQTLQIENCSHGMPSRAFCLLCTLNQIRKDYLR